MIKKGNLYYPSKKFKENAVINNKEIYKTANKNPIKFWDNLARELFWHKQYTKVFSHNPPYFQWFVNGKINITSNIFENNSNGFDNIKNKTALIWEPERVDEKSRVFTYYEMYQEMNRLANALKKMGVKKGDRIGIYMPMIPEAIIAMLACARIGAIHTVVFSAFSPAALRVRLQDTKAKILITADGYYRRGKVIDLKKNAEEGIKQTDIKKVVVVKRAKNKVKMKKSRDYWYSDLIKKQSDNCPAKIMDSEDMLFILYTSGSTGKPKGCVHTCGGYAVQAKFTGKWIFDWQDNNNDIFWSMADLGWVTGHTYSCYSPLLNATSFLIFEGAPNAPKPDRWAKIIEKHKITIFYTSPTAVRMFAKYGVKMIKKYKFSSLRLLGSVGEPIDEASWKWYFNNVGKKRCPIVDTWWQTETGGILITSLPGVGPFKPSFTGIPFPGLKFEILDEKGKKLPAMKQGNLVLQPPFCPGLLRGVYKNSKRYLDTYWNEYGKKVYFTSDGAIQNKQGLIRIIGRIDDVIKVAGHRLTTGEMEDAITGIKDVSECAVIGISDEIKGEVPVVFAVSAVSSASLASSENVSPAEKRYPKINEEIRAQIIAKLRKDIGPIAKPKQIYLVDDLPKTRSGKTMRRILKKLFTGENLGDLSTLANAESVGKVKKIIKNQ